MKEVEEKKGKMDENRVFGSLAYEYNTGCSLNIVFFRKF